MMHKLRFLFAAYGLLLFAACQPDAPVSPKNGTYDRGVFAVNEGIFGQTSGSISFYNPLNFSSEQAIFKKQNQRDLGDVVQSLSFINQKAYIVVNNSNKIEIADAQSFEEIDQLNSLKLPRYIKAVSSHKAYISEWGLDGLSGQLSVLNLQNNSISKTIPVAFGPEHLFSNDQYLYISHSGGFGDNNKLSILDTLSDQIIQTIVVGDRPGSLHEDNQNRLWFLCSGKTVYTSYPLIDTNLSTESMLLNLDANHHLDTVLNFGKTNSARYLNINADKTQLYFYRNGQVWAYDLISQSEQALLTENLYGMTAHPTENKLYLATSAGIDVAEALIYSTSGTFEGSFTTAYFTNGFVFK